MNRRLVALLIPFALLAACGGDDDSTVAAKPEATTSTTNASGGDGSPCDEPEPGCPGNLATAVDDYRATPAACGGNAAPLSDGIDAFGSLGQMNDGELITVTCDTFAYQATYEIMRWDGSALLPVDVEQWRDGKVVHDPVVLGSPYVEGDSIANLEKGRGLGDCGVFSLWVVNESVVLETVHERDDCGGDATNNDPFEWPVVYDVPALHAEG